MEIYVNIKVLILFTPDNAYHRGVQRRGGSRRHFLRLFRFLNDVKTCLQYDFASQAIPAWLLFWGCRLRTAVSCITARLCAKTDVCWASCRKHTCPITMNFTKSGSLHLPRQKNGVIDLSGAQVPFGTNLLFQCGTQPALTLAVEICEDLWAPCLPVRGTPWQAPHLSAIFPPVTRPSARLNTAVRL